MLALNMLPVHVAETKLNSQCTYLVRVGARLPSRLRAGAHPEIWPSIARSLSRDGMAIFKIQTYLTRITCTRVSAFILVPEDSRCWVVVALTPGIRNQLAVPPRCLVRTFPFLPF